MEFNLVNYDAFVKSGMELGFTEDQLYSWALAIECGFYKAVKKDIRDTYRKMMES